MGLPFPPKIVNQKQQLVQRGTGEMHATWWEQGGETSHTHTPAPGSLHHGWLLQHPAPTVPWSAARSSVTSLWFPEGSAGAAP